MIKNYLTIALRNINRNKIGSLINIFGLAVGISSCIFIFLFVRNELGYDKKNPAGDRIYRVDTRVTLTGQTDNVALSSFMLAPILKANYPEIETAIRLMPIYRQTIWLPGQVFQVDNVFMTDPDFFKIFNYQFISGDAKTALAEPYTIVLTEESAQLMFGTTEHVLGRMLKFARSSYKVTGVIKAPKNQSHINLGALISITSLAKPFEQTLTLDWMHLAQATYILFKNKEDAAHFEPKFRTFEDKYIKPFLTQYKVQGKMSFSLEPMPGIHLSHPAQHFDYADIGNRSYIYIFSMVAIFILLIACINYMNLATARSTKRAKEVGIRKTAGATRTQLVQQFISESVLITLVSVVIALCINELLLPFFNQLIDKSLTLSLTDPGLLAFIISVVLFVGVISGLYPAFYLSRFQPIQVLKTNNVPKSGSVRLRKVLVVVQFSISIVLIIGTLVVYQQIHYIKNKDIGFSKDHVYVLNVPTADSSFRDKFQDLKNELLQNNHVLKIAGSEAIPGLNRSSTLQFVEHDQIKEERLMSNMVVDYDFLSMLNIPTVMGRAFSKDFPSDDTAALMVNETAVREFGWKDPLNIKIQNAFGRGKIIGVVKDFNVASLHEPIEPLLLSVSRRIPFFLLVKVKPDDLPSTVNFIETKWKMFSKKYPMDAYFLDDNFNKQYRGDEKMLTIFAWFSALTIIIACMGLLALTSFTMEQRTKEIGIRKVMGASTYNIVALLTGDFMKLVLIALVIAAPIAWFAMDKWLQDFAYRIEVSIWVVLLAALVSFLVALLTVGYQAIKAAQQNPAVSIKYE